MKRFKEIIVIVLLIGVTVFLAFIPMINSNSNKEDTKEKSTPSTIKINITGELKVDELNIRIPYGYSYGYIISKIELYLNGYSIIDENKAKRYYEDTKIVIESSDIKPKTVVEESSNDDGKININTASLNDLITLYGIGEKRANLIIEYRATKKIESFNELKELIGVSNEVIENIKEKAVL